VIAFPYLRSLLFVPGDDEHKLTKALNTAADALILDWEDGVSPESKSLARSQTAGFLSNGSTIHGVVLIRLNPVHGPHFKMDIAHAGNVRIDGFVLSKVTSVEDLRQVKRLAAKRSYRADLRLFPMIESAAGLLNAPAIAAYPSVTALLFGAEDFCADTGIICSSEEIELNYARSAIVTAARALERQVIDSPCLEFTDDQAVVKAASRARNLGFTGKLAIHPRQVALVNETFIPLPEEIEKAERILKAFADSGEGVTAVDGAMVDEATVKRARQIVQLAKRAHGK
jgi:citrate lyase subunit beta / citryl-CoA lyase